MKPKIKTVDAITYPELAIAAKPPTLLEIIRTGNASALQTRDVNIFYVLADYLEKKLKGLKEKCRLVIIARREEGKPSGKLQQHREFAYQLPTGSVHLTVQERILAKPNLQKLEALLRSKKLWESALTSTVDLNKVDAMLEVGLITAEELASVSDTPEPTYALIARFDAVAEQSV